MAFSNYLLTALCQLMFGQTAFTPPATIYVGLSTTPPNADGSNITEPVGNGYSRFAIPNDTAHWRLASGQPATGDRQSNQQAFNFPQVTADWGTVTHLVMYDAPSGGNFLGWGQLDTPRNMVAGTTLTFAAEALTATMQ